MTPSDFYMVSSLAGVFIGKLLLAVSAIALMGVISFTQDKE